VQQNLLLIQQDDRFDSLDKATRFIITALSEFRSKFESEFEKHIAKVNHLVGQDVTRDPNLRSHRSLVDTVTKLYHNTHQDSILPAGEKGPSNIPSMGSGDLHYISNQTFSNMITQPSVMLTSTRLGNSTVRTLAEEGVLRSLKFATMEERYDEVAEAHRKTFEWIFRDPDARCRRWDNFADWLKAGKGIYWVNGKAASGKSTLMKFVYDHLRTQGLLREWADGKPLNTAGFFFWNSGTTEQRSHKGLLKSLLYQALSHQRELIPHVLPRRWSKRAELLSDSSDLMHSGCDVAFDEIWTLTRLKEAFTLLCNQTIVPSKLCYFIDGLDEYDGDCAEISQLLQDTASLPNVKVCVSSRPWLIFEDAFKGLPTLRLQDLTRLDIMHYAQESLESNRRWTDIANHNPGAASSLVHEIVSKSDGVFLWVRLVTLSLLNGLHNHDDISDLQKRLGLIPSDLKKLYMHMLEAIQPQFYLEKASRIFQIVRKAREAREYLNINQLAEPSPFTVLELAFSLNNTEDGEESTQKDGDCTRWALMKSRHIACMLKTRCAGLLELGEGTTLDQGVGKDTPLDSRQDCWSPLQPVVYLHRTARDFLEEGENWDTIVQHNTDKSFHPCTALLRSSVGFLKLVNDFESPLPCKAYLEDWSGRAPESDRKWSAIFQGLLYAYWIDLETGDAQETLLDELNQIATSQHTSCSSLDEHWSSHSPLNLKGQHVGWQDSFISNAIQYGLYSYVSRKLAKDPDLIKKKRGMPLLDYGIYLAPSNIEFETRTKIVTLLLEHGALPNKSFKGLSAWQLALGLASKRLQSNNDTSRTWLIIITEFVIHGADPLAKCDGVTALDYVDRLFKYTYPNEAAELQGLLRKRLSREENHLSGDVPESDDILHIKNGTITQLDMSKNSSSRTRKWKTVR
jgi:hypothetical protein